LAGADGRDTAWQLFDDLLAALGPEGALEHFFLDGHLAALDDYLRARPDAEGTLRAAASSGRLGLGPNRVLMDEHASSGETIVHNLQAGWKRANHLGERPRVALLPPTWGHVAQLPQLLRQAGVDHVVVTAGSWPATTRSAFWWRSPDGSTVRAEYRAAHPPRQGHDLPGSTGRAGTSGASDCSGPPDDGGELARRAEQLIDSLVALEEGPARELLAPGAALLWLHRADLSELVGSSFLTHAESLAKLLHAVNSGQGKYLLRVTAPREYFEAVGSDGLPSITGELRPMLLGTAGNAAVARGGRDGDDRDWDDRDRQSGDDKDQRGSELRGCEWEGTFSGRLDLATAAAVAERSLERLAEPLCTLWLEARQWPGQDLLSAWDQLVRASGWRLANKTAAAAPGLAGKVVPSPAGAVVYPYGLVANVANSARQLALASAARAFQGAGSVVINPSARARSGVVELSPTPDGTTIGPFAQQLGPGRALAWAASVPGYGWATLPTRAPGAAGEPEPVHSKSSDLGDPNLDNGLVRLSVSPADGSFAINGHLGFGRLIDETDAGDTLCFRQSTQTSRAFAERHGSQHGATAPPRATPAEVGIHVVESGPLRGRIEVVRRYVWSYMASDVLTELELRAGESMVRVTNSFFNERPGHRLRTVLPLPRRAAHSLADCAFAGTERPAYPEASYPTKSFVCASGVVVAHDGLSEYTVGADGWALVLTLLRSTPSRDIAAEAGPGSRSAADVQAMTGWERAARLGPWARACPGPEQLGHHVARYALAVGDPSQGPAGGLDPWQLAEDALVPLQVVVAAGGGHLPARGTHLAVTGARVSALRRHGEGFELRAFNPSSEPVLVQVPTRTGELVDLQGNCLAYWEGSFALGPWSIATVLVHALPPT
jgi:alpha-mannosidase